MPNSLLPSTCCSVDLRDEVEMLVFRQQYLMWKAVMEETLYLCTVPFMTMHSTYIDTFGPCEYQYTRTSSPYIYVYINLFVVLITFDF